MSDHTSSDDEEEDTQDEPEEVPENHKRTTSFGSLRSPSLKAVRGLFQSKGPPSAPWREPQPFEVLRAVERKDIMFLMEIRDRAFPVCPHLA